MYSSAHESPQKKPKITLGEEKEQKKDSAALLELINDNLTDPITLDIMNDPVILIETGIGWGILLSRFPRKMHAGSTSAWKQFYELAA